LNIIHAVQSRFGDYVNAQCPLQHLDFATAKVCRSWIVSGQTSALLPFCRNDGTAFDAVSFHSNQIMSKSQSGKSHYVTLVRNFDAFDSVRVGCCELASDIEAVTLYQTIHLGADRFRKHSLDVMMRIPVAQIKRSDTCPGDVFQLFPHNVLLPRDVLLSLEVQWSPQYQQFLTAHGIVPVVEVHATYLSMALLKKMETQIPCPEFRV
jgi:hypothetical protein